MRLYMIVYVFEYDGYLSSIELIKVLFNLLRSQDLEFAIFSDHAHLNVVAAHLALETFLKS